MFLFLGKYPQRSKKEEKGTPSPVRNVPKEVEKKKRVYRPRREMSLKVEKLRKGYTGPGGKYPQRSRKEEKGTPAPVRNVPKEVKKKKRDTFTSNILLRSIKY